MIQLCENTDVNTRTWGHLQNAETHRTLELAPGQSAEVDLPPDFSDPYLKPVPVAAPAPKPPKGATPDPTDAGEPAPAKE